MPFQLGTFQKNYVKFLVKYLSDDDLTSVKLFDEKKLLPKAPLAVIAKKIVAHNDLLSCSDFAILFYSGFPL